MINSVDTPHSEFKCYSNSIRLTLTQCRKIQRERGSPDIIRGVITFDVQINTLLCVTRVASLDAFVLMWLAAR
jgi:hypothetical protein